MDEDFLYECCGRESHAKPSCEPILQDESLPRILARGGGCLSFVQGSRGVVEESWAIVEVTAQSGLSITRQFTDRQ